VRRIGVEERRARLARRHHLAEAARAADVVTVAEGVVALHATDPASVFLSAMARMRAASIESIEAALYDKRSLIRMLGMRRTVFVVPVEVMPIVQASTTDAIAVKQRRTLEQLIEDGGVAHPAGPWLAEVEAKTLAALAARGEARAAELSTAVPELRTRFSYGEGKSWASEANISTRVIFLLAAEGHIVRGRPMGSWISTQYRWSPTSSWLVEDAESLPADQARVELARRWLASYGPATVADLKWWTGWTLTQARKALSELGPVEVDLDGVPGVVLPGDEAPVGSPKPWAALLPALDPTVMGWTGRAWYLGEHGPALFDRSGNPGPTVWWDGRIVGGWVQRRSGEIAVRLLEDVSADAVTAIDVESERMAAFIGDSRVTPRFRTPLERELSA
jgi:Winged helix DNA-binding domain